MAIDLRELVPTTLLGDSVIRSLVVDRVYQFGTVPTSPARPYLVVKLGLQVPEPRWRGGPTERPFQVWAHDDVGDYNKIDLLLDRCKVLLPALPNTGDFLEIRFIDMTQDLDDLALGDILRYTRFRASFSS